MRFASHPSSISGITTDMRSKQTWTMLKWSIWSVGAGGVGRADANAEGVPCDGVLSGCLPSRLGWIMPPPPPSFLLARMDIDIVPGGESKKSGVDLHFRIGVERIGMGICAAAPVSSSVELSSIFVGRDSEVDSGADVIALKGQ